MRCRPVAPRLTCRLASLRPWSIGSSRRHERRRCRGAEVPAGLEILSAGRTQHRYRLVHRNPAQTRKRSTGWRVTHPSVSELNPAKFLTQHNPMGPLLRSRPSGAQPVTRYRYPTAPWSAGPHSTARRASGGTGRTPAGTPSITPSAASSCPSRPAVTGHWAVVVDMRFRSISARCSYSLQIRTLDISAS
jgi:hypothetical protein